jgi:hypothetical protein
MEVLLQEVSKRYQNVMEIKEESRDDIQVEFRLLHPSQDEIVAKTTHLVPISDEVADHMEKYFVTEIEEAQLMRMVAHPHYISEVKEEIFILQEDHIDNYCLVYEKAEQTLDSIPEIWKFKK